MNDVGDQAGQLRVTLSHELLGLLSEQLYQSPSKAIEELVVNAFDADALLCRIVVPAAHEDPNVVLVYDDGDGMDAKGLEVLWHVGHSSKQDERLSKHRRRKQIGKFGIGKLATYSIANRVTYISRVADRILATALDYGRFTSSPTGPEVPVILDMKSLTDDQFRALPGVRDLLPRAGVTEVELLTPGQTWTVVVLEDLKPKAAQLYVGRLRQVLATAMPLKTDFSLYLNGELVRSAKSESEPVAEFNLVDLPNERIANLSTVTGETWSIVSGALVSTSFPSGISGTALVTKQTIYAGKSADLMRSHGFFVKVRDRLVNIEDPLFGLKPLSYTTFNRFRADLVADDLDVAVTAPREGVEGGPITEKFQNLLSEIYYEARSRYEGWLTAKAKEEANAREHERNYVNPRLVERPIADVLSQTSGQAGGDADSTWFYLSLPEGIDLKSVTSELYGDGKRTTYKYDRTQLGSTGRLARFHPMEALFQLNIDHPFIQAYDSDGAAQPLLEDIVTAEALLEIYMREEGLAPTAVGDLLERRDQLLRSLVKDRVYSLRLIARELRDSSANERALEINLVVAMRALGFVAKHLSNAGQPDGLARFSDYPGGETLLTLEAKSSATVPSLGAIDFAGLARHVSDKSAKGCLLVAPEYPGATREADAAAAKTAQDLRISCWTVDQLARVVEAAEDRQIHARDVIDIVLQQFSPADVSAAVDARLSAQTWSTRELYVSLVAALRGLEGRLPDAARSVDALATAVVLRDDLAANKADVRRALQDMAGSSKGALVVRGELVVLNTSIDELERRTAGLLGRPGEARRASTFRKHNI